MLMSKVLYKAPRMFVVDIRSIKVSIAVQQSQAVWCNYCYMEKSHSEREHGKGSLIREAAAMLHSTEMVSGQKLIQPQQSTRTLMVLCEDGLIDEVRVLVCISGVGV